MNSSMYIRPRQQPQQQRSHSISGQELNFNEAGYQRLNQFISQQQQQNNNSPELERHRQRNYGIGQMPVYQSSGQLQLQQQQHLRTQMAGAAARSPSPLSYAGHIEQNNRDILSKYQSQDTIQKPRNQLHASLECLNSSYIEYHHQQQQQQQQQQQFRQQQQQMSLQNQHYASATNYMLATPPANTVVNQSGEQDLAAAAMDNGGLHVAHHLQYQYQQQQQQQSPTPTANGGSIYAQQSIINRAMVQLNQSPARRFSSAQHGATGMASSLINNLASLQQLRAGHHTSSLSLASQAAPSSPSSSSYIIIEDKLQNEIRKLQGELKSEREKNEALNSQLNINSNLMAAFEQSLTTLNSRLRQLTTINERKDQEIEELRMQLELSKLKVDDRRPSPAEQRANISSPAQSDSYQLMMAPDQAKASSGADRSSQEKEEDLAKVVEDLRRQLIEKDRLLTDTRLEALSAAHQLERLESRLDKGQQGSLDEEIEELRLGGENAAATGRSPSDSDGAVTDSAHYSEINSSQVGERLSCDGERPVAVRLALDATSENDQLAGEGCLVKGSPEFTNHQLNTTDDRRSNHSSDYQDRSSASEVRAMNDDQMTTNNLSESDSQQFHSPANGSSTSPMDRLMDSLLSGAG